MKLPRSGWLLICFQQMRQVHPMFQPSRKRRLLTEEETHVVFEKIVEYIGETSAMVNRLYDTSFQVTQ